MWIREGTAFITQLVYTPLSEQANPLDKGNL